MPKITYTDYLGSSKDSASYDESYNHWSLNLIAQLCRESRKPVIYAGFDTFVKMSSNNPRNLLGILSNAYDLALFNDLDFIYNNEIIIVINYILFIFFNYLI